MSATEVKESHLQGEDGDKDFEEDLTLVNEKGLNSTLATLYSTPAAKIERPSQVPEDAGKREGEEVGRVRAASVHPLKALHKHLH